MEQTLDNLEETLASVWSEDLRYTTEPMSAVTTEQLLNEEELHRLFEESISDRVLVVSACLKRISRPLPFETQTTKDVRFTDPDEGSMVTNPIRVPDSAGRWLSLGNKTWQQAIILLSLALFLLLSGFDLMGMLVLHLR